MTQSSRLSRHGLAPCPSCSRHVRVEPEASSTVCPFCGATGFQIERIDPSALSRRRAALWAPTTIAAALIGATFLLTSCEEVIDGPVYGGPPVQMDAGVEDAGTADSGAPDAN